jgi:Na+-transporting methylmalonyl-CoA/oxaloacetate decarboxylase gamma subunit
VSFLDLAVWLLRAIGLFYLIGGFVALRQAWFMHRSEPMLDNLLDALDALQADHDGAPPSEKRETDRGRALWLIAGALVLIAAGAAMVFAHSVCLALLTLLVVQQMLYFVRQRRMELKAPNAEIAEEARPTAATTNAFFGALAVTVFAAWLYWMSALN